MLNELPFHASCRWTLRSVGGESGKRVCPNLTHFCKEFLNRHKLPITVQDWRKDGKKEATSSSYGSRGRLHRLPHRVAAEWEIIVCLTFR